MNLEQAQVLYDRNLSMLLDKVRQKRRVIYRVMMDSEGLILSITPCRAGKPQSSCFTLIVPGGHQPPKFGALTTLEGYQIEIARQLELDLLKLLRVNEVAYVLKNCNSPVLDRKAQGHVDELVKRFGKLPEPAMKHVDDSERERQILLAQQEEEKQQIWTEAVPDFEELLQAELQQQQAATLHLRRV